MFSFHSRTRIIERGRSAEYHLFVPSAQVRARTRQLPLLVYLHGISESEGLPMGPLVRVRPLIEELGADHFPFLVLIPRCRAFPATWQASSQDGKAVLSLVDEICREFDVDRARIYLTGVSMGGFGTWSLAAAHPERWAAIAPVCGGGDPRHAERLKDVPIWAFHGSADPIVPVEFTRAMITAVGAAGGSPKYTEYPGVGHDSWKKAYRERELFEWMARQKRFARVSEVIHLGPVRAL